MLELTVGKKYITRDGKKVTIIFHSDDMYKGNNGCDYNDKGNVIRGVNTFDIVAYDISTAKDIQVAGNHYKKYKIQPWDIIESWLLDFFEGNVIKYVLRQKQDHKEDLQKACHYLQYLIENKSFQTSRQFLDDIIEVEQILETYNLHESPLSEVLYSFYNAIMTNNYRIRKEHLGYCLKDLQKYIKEL